MWFKNLEISIAADISEKLWSAVIKKGNWKNALFNSFDLFWNKSRKCRINKKLEIVQYWVIETELDVILNED
jgi:hypothetical protein